MIDWKNKEEVKKYNKKYYNKNRDKILERVKRYNKEYPEKRREWEKKNPNYREEYNREYSKKNREKLTKKTRDRRKKNPVKVKARLYAQNHKQIGDICNLCGAKEKLHFHHTNYGMNEGITLCTKCHANTHKELKKRVV